MLDDSTLIRAERLIRGDIVLWGGATGRSDWPSPPH